jgi:tetratricopeptide (TPR) repeat protein
MSQWIKNISIDTIVSVFSSFEKEHAWNDVASSDDETDPEKPAKVEEDQRVLEEEIDESALAEQQKDWTDDQLSSARAGAQESKTEGNTHFLAERYVEAVRCYTECLKSCPVKFSKDRAVFYQNRGACKARLDQHDLAVADLSKAVELDPDYFKARLKRAQVYEKAEKLDEALADYQHLLTMDPRHRESFEACQRLPAQIQERNEKLKDEMLSKLKDLGNLVLRPFGLSTDNFKLNQDPNTGGYSISMQNSRNS